ncbi:MAG: hypothetical protein NW237_13410 [Cyanobacteriota bacterium]|nr:hypothetical protein [Cyanobacteriota bacterium]
MRVPPSSLCVLLATCLMGGQVNAQTLSPWLPMPTASPLLPTDLSSPETDPLLLLFPLWPTQPPQSPELTVDLVNLSLLPDGDLAESMDAQFNQEVAILNRQINDKQAQMHEQLLNWSSSPDQIRQIQVEVSNLKAERDRLALEHLLVMRQLQQRFVIPTRTPTAEGSPKP